MPLFKIVYQTRTKAYNSSCDSRLQTTLLLAYFSTTHHHSVDTFGYNFVCTQIVMPITPPYSTTQNVIGPAAIRNFSRMMFSLDAVLRQQTFEHLLLDCSVTWTRYFNDAYNCFRFIYNSILSQWSLLHKPNVLWLIPSRLTIHETPRLRLLARVTYGSHHWLSLSSPTLSIFYVVFSRLTIGLSHAVDAGLD